MQDFYTNLLTAAGSLIIGVIITLITSRLIKNILLKLTSKTKNEIDDYIAQSVLEVIKPLGYLISTSIFWKLLPINKDIDGVS